MNRTPYFMGIDNGGSKVKCAVFDSQGYQLAAASEALSIRQPAPGYRERLPQDVWEANLRVIRKALSRSDIRPQQITALSLCGYGGGFVLLDKRNFPVSPIILSTDTRAHRQLEVLKESGAAQQIFSRTHQKLWEAQAAPLLAWFRENQPETLNRTRCMLTVKDFLRAKLTGILAAELTDASNHNLIDPETRQYSQELFSFSRLSAERRLFPAPLLLPTAIAGRITQEAAAATGLPEGTPVAAGLYDVSSCTLGCGALRPDTPALINGTWSMASRLSPDFAQADDSTIVTTAPMAGAFLLEQGSPTGTVNLEWYLDHFLSRTHPHLSREQLYAICAEAVQDPDRNNPALFIPHLYLDVSNQAPGGAFLNLTGCHGERELLYSVMEGILLSARRHVNLLQKGAPPFSKAILSGGISASPSWSQMFCDMLQLPLSIPDGSQQGARGAAMCAAIAMGEFDNFHQAAEAMVPIKTTLFPRPQYREFYAERACLYESALKALALISTAGTSVKQTL